MVMAGEHHYRVEGEHPHDHESGKLRTSENRGAPLRGQYSKLPVSSKQRIREIGPAEVIGPGHYFRFLLYTPTLAKSFSNHWLLVR
ncbi:hypothetical protein TNIN_181521 [Trichonephila inaurata madagascariensis]|uniref:Uncharacterized protein n=1 Tax=Trichonephila inaurata madagascariensis TaxID=2747483 RepID=A0A8X7CGN5_9ARAC|nr:hypothetical protein TNIN_181521 [Trichonephila inaurata madagascariensis]